MAGVQLYDGLIKANTRNLLIKYNMHTEIRQATGMREVRFIIVSE